MAEGGTGDDRELRKCRRPLVGQRRDDAGIRRKTGGKEQRRLGMLKLRQAPFEFRSADLRHISKMWCHDPDHRELVMCDGYFKPDS